MRETEAGERAGTGVAFAWMIAIVTLATASCGGGRSDAANGVAEDAPSDSAPALETATLGSDTTLQRLAAELLPAAEERSGLESRRPVALARSSRETLEAFLISELDEELPPEKAAAITSVYVRLGLLPSDLDLRDLLRSLYLEQVVGYYDPSADTLFVREGVPPDQLRPVLLHEIVHALQDQRMDLDSTMQARSDDNDAAMAARAAVEGHATFAMLEWQLAQATGPGTDMAALPDLGGLLSGTDLAAAAGMPVLSEAPRLIRESLLFPYVGGLTFVQRYWRMSSGRPVPLNEDLPASTEQVLHPDRFAGEDRDAPSRLRFGDEAPSGWETVYADGLGELEIRVLLSTFVADTARAGAAAAGWDGDRYRLLRPAGDAAAEGGATDLFVWASVWDTEEDAGEFARGVEEALRERYRDPVYGGGEIDPAHPDAGTERRVRVSRPSTERPSVLVIDAPADMADRIDGTVFDFDVEGGG